MIPMSFRENLEVKNSFPLARPSSPMTTRFGLHPYTLKDGSIKL